MSIESESQRLLAELRGNPVAWTALPTSQVTTLSTRIDRRGRWPSQSRLYTSFCLPRRQKLKKIANRWTRGPSGHN
jgi:hypothetical protein